ncbi:MAG: 3'-5' exonuclease [Gemmatimonadetes bacterium]|nr:3'-5' exonuclease [Gemmatimonadota bacterium]
MTLPIRLDRPLAVVDLETTGLNIARDRIVELAVLRIDPDGTLSERVRRFNPGIPIPPEASAVHGITDADVAAQPAFAARARSLLELLDPCDLAGFNLRRFDLPMILAEFRRAGLHLELRGRRLIDMKTIFHREEPRSLAAAARFYLGRDAEDAHSALGDARTSAAVLRSQLERYAHLPRDLEGLHRYCDETQPFQTEVDRWFRQDESGAHVFRRGKHQDHRLEDVARAEPDYLYWMLDADIDESVLALVREALEAAQRGEAPAPATYPELPSD